MESLGYRYLLQCRANYFNKVRPANPNRINSEGYIKLVAIAKSFFDKNMIEYFSGFFQEGQYFVQLWTAHLILEYGKPSEQLEKKSIEIIQKYAQDSLDPDVILEERNWLELHYLNDRLIPFVSMKGNNGIEELSIKRSFKDWAMAFKKLLRKEKKV